MSAAAPGPALHAWLGDLLRERAGLALAPGTEYLVAGRLLPLARELGHPTATALLGAMRAGGAAPDPALVTRVVDAVAQHETSWFRDPAAFEALADHVLPAVLAARPAGEPLRLWSASCSTGQEAHGLAAVALDAVRTAGSPSPVRVLASDLSAGVVERTRAGRYSALEVARGLDPARRDALLVPDGGATGGAGGTGGWRVRPEVAAVVRTEVVNLARPLPTLPGPFDVVLLRNTLIHMDLPARQRVLARVRAAMRPDGWLLLGAAEAVLGVDEAWERVVVGRTPFHRPLAAVPPLPRAAGDAATAPTPVRWGA